MRSLYAPKPLRSGSFGGAEPSHHPGDLGSCGSFRPEATHRVKGPFDPLAWSDGALDGDEIALLDHLCEEIPDFRELYEAHDTYEPTDPTFGEIPRLLTAVVGYDRHTGERLAPMLVAELETLGYAIVGASGAPIDIAKAELRTDVSGLRGLCPELLTASAVSLF